MKSNSWLNALCTLTMMLTAAPALASGTLDGKRFDGVFMERGKTSGDADTLTFRDGRFRSSACDKYGYSDAAYKTSTTRMQLNTSKKWPNGKTSQNPTKCASFRAGASS